MSWSPQQEAAIKLVRAWLMQKNGPQVFHLFGFAGTGKTTLVMELANAVRGLVLYGAYTGKAALVLRSKGCENATTLHSMIYRPEEGPDGAPVFALNRESAASLAELIVIDEVSMVDEELGADLLSFGKKVLVLGDPFQLKPVKGDGYFMTPRPEVMLTEVHRQAADNPIIRMSMDIREGRRLKPGTYGESLVVERRNFSRDDLREIALRADQILCGVNKTRHTLNARMRELRGMVGTPHHWLPVAGDRLICLKNNHELGLLNGSLWNLDEVRDYSDGELVLKVTCHDYKAEGLTLTVKQEFFNGTEKNIDWRELKYTEQFTYGNAITVHKSQGSQFNDLLLFDESGTFRDQRAQHLYTGITRAAQRATVVI